MVSNLYTAEKFYELQKDGKVASKMGADKKLRKGKNGYFLEKSTPNGQVYKQKVGAKDLVYARSKKDGVTMYNKELDGTKRTQGLKEGVKVHSKYAQLQKGTKVEMEHTKDIRYAEKIAKTHLEENPNYYAKYNPNKKTKEYLVN